MSLSSAIFKRLICSTTLSVVSLISAQTALANPVDGNVVAGSATISGGTQNLDIYQHSDRAIIDWRSFNIGINEETRFHQPNSNSIVVNRINDTNPSQILGKLTANGNVVLINPNGLLFGQHAVVDVNGLVATTADIDNDLFMQGSNNFNKASSNTDAVIRNDGQITAREAGLVGLVAPNVINNGLIQANLGRVEMASGDTVTVDFRGNGLINIAVSEDIKSQLVSNTGTLSAAGGTIALTAAAGKNIVNSLIEVKGELKAPAVSQKSGKIQIFAAGSNAVAGNISADKGKKSGNSRIIVSGKLDVSGKSGNEKGGHVDILGDDILIKSGSLIDASGNTGGGNIRIGGDYKGQGSVSTAYSLEMESGSKILNNALRLGNGGRTILWSDDTTLFRGDIEGKGGTLGGQGGFVETSGKINLLAQGTVDLRAIDGTAGNWLLDPSTITIYNRSNNGTNGVNSFTTAALETLSLSANILLQADDDIILNMGGDTLTAAANRNITLTATNGRITSNSNGTIITSGTGSVLFNAGTYLLFSNDLNITAQGTGSVTLQAGDNITSTGNITTAGGDIIINSDRNTDGNGSINVNYAVLTSSGGNIIMGGGLDPETGYATGASYFSGPGINLNNATLNAQGITKGGNITLNGQGWQSGYTMDGSRGIVALDSIIQTSHNGNITLRGKGGGSSDNFGNMGIRIKGGSLASVNGDINIHAVGGVGAGGLLHDNGVTPGRIESSGTGSIFVNSQADQASGGSVSIDLRTIGGGIYTNSGSITLSDNTQSGISIRRFFLSGGNISSHSGNISLSDTGTNIYSSVWLTDAHKIGSSTSTGNINFQIGGITFSSGTLDIETTGALTIRTNGYQDISLGTTGATSIFHMPTSFLDRITAKSITIGSTTNGGTLNVAAYNWRAPLTLLGNGTININGNQNMGAHKLTIQTTGYFGSINLNGAITSSATGNAVDINSNGYLYSFGSITASSGTVEMAARDTLYINSNISSTGFTGTTASYGSYSSYGSISVGSGNVTITADKIHIGNQINGTGILTLSSQQNNINVNTGPDDGTDFNLDATEMANLGSGWNKLILESPVFGHITLGDNSWNNNLELNTNFGNIHINGAQAMGNRTFLAKSPSFGSIYMGVTGSVTSTAAGDAIVLNSSNHFYNTNSSADTLSANNGRWLVYSTNPGLNIRGGLMPNATALYGKTYFADAPSTIAAGNRFIFNSDISTAPALVFTAQDQTKVSGAINGVLGYTLSGFIDNDDASNAFFGTPGFNTAVNNHTAAGNYAISVDTSALSSYLGYRFETIDGNYHVTPAAAPPVIDKALLPNTVEYTIQHPVASAGKASKANVFTPVGSTLIFSGYGLSGNGLINIVPALIKEINPQPNIKLDVAMDGYSNSLFGNPVD